MSAIAGRVGGVQILGAMVFIESLATSALLNPDLRSLLSARLKVNFMV